MTTRLSKMLIAGALLISSLPASAEHEPDRPLYFGFAIGFPASNQDCDYYGYNCDGTDTGFKVYGGKQLHENFAVEIAFHDLGRLRNEQGGFETIAQSEGLNLSLVGLIPFNEFGFFYGKAGYMLADTRYSRIEGGVTTQTDDESGDFSFGAGVAFRFGQHYDIRAEFESLNDLSGDFAPGGDTITSFSIGGTVYLD